MVLILSAYLFCLFNLASLSPSVIKSIPDDCSDDLVVSLPSGKIRGKQALSIGQQKLYFAYQGIPYAESPVGELRFKPPVRKSKWAGILKTDEDKSQCLQEGDPPRGSEDCLYINVYVPAALAGKQNTPVMVWIHGGGSVGNSSYIHYPPDHLVDEGIIYVSFNYRLGIYGFGSTEDSECPGNFGIKDQILALKWIQENIAVFGGNPRQVTIFGESSGAGLVSNLLQTDTTKDLFKQAIMNSGNSLCAWSLDTKAKETMFAIGRALNIDTSSSATLINGLKKIDSITLQKIAYGIYTNVTLNNPLGGLTFGPVKEPGIIEGYGDQILSEGRFPRRSIIIGFTSNESGEVGDGLSNYFPEDRGIDHLVPISLTKNRTKILSAASKIRSFYFGTSPILSQREAAMNYLNDHLHQRPAVRTVTHESKYVPVYFYIFSFANGSRYGAPHARDLPYLFSYNITLSPEDKIVQLRIVRLWTNFAKYGNPTPAKDGLLQNVSWLPANSVPHKQIYLNIDTNLKQEVLQENPINARIKFWNKIFTEFGDPPYDTY